jgi:hypothetical protein
MGWTIQVLNPNRGNRFVSSIKTSPPKYPYFGIVVEIVGPYDDKSYAGGCIC